MVNGKNRLQNSTTKSSGADTHLFGLAIIVQKTLELNWQS